MDLKSRSGAYHYRKQNSDDEHYTMYDTILNQNIFKIISIANPIINGVQMFKSLLIMQRKGTNA